MMITSRLYDESYNIMKKMLFALLLCGLAFPVTAMNRKMLNDALISAMDWEWWDEIKILIDQGADINIQDPWGDTPLHRAAYFGNIEMVQLLLKKGANKHLKNKKGRTPANLAAEAIGELTYSEHSYPGMIQKFAEIFEILKKKEEKSESL